MIEAILLDIEGTTTPIDFVHKTLFPFAAKRLTEYIDANLVRMADEIAQLKVEHSNDVGYNAPFDDSSSRSVSDYLHHLIHVDRKSTSLKSIQGKIWQHGYEAKDIKSEVFDDVPPAFERWRAKGRTVAIYSSGSVLAQRLLFKYTMHGDLTPFISEYFDTNTGSKLDAQSYQNIANLLKLPPAAISFVSDATAELVAAQKAGLHSVLSVRPGNTPIESRENFRIVTTFDSLW